LLDVADQLKRSAHAALGLAINCAVIPVAGQRTHGTTFRALKVTFQEAQSAVYDCLVKKQQAYFRLKAGRVYDAVDWLPHDK